MMRCDNLIAALWHIQPAGRLASVRSLLSRKHHLV